MQKVEVLKSLKEIGLVPVLRAESVDKALALAEAIAPRMRAGDVVEINGEYEAGSSLSFYLRRQVRILNGRSSNLWYGSLFNDAPRIFDDNVSFRQRWSGPDRIFLWTPVDQVPALPGAVYSIARSGGKEILSNQQ